MDADHDIGAHGPHHVGRHIAHQAAIDVNMFRIADGRKQSGNGHGRAHGGGERSILEYRLLPGHQVGGDAAEGNRQIVERLHTRVRQGFAIDQEADLLASVQSAGQGEPLRSPNRIELGNATLSSFLRKDRSS